jgi:protein-S-isoprenylcysteine O-methyltransferase Ste14
MRPNNDQKIKREYAVRRTRQIIAIATAIILLLLVALVYKRPAILGEFSKKDLVIAQIIIILGFINFSAFNWICPACKKYLGSDLHRSICKKCGAKLR